MTQFPMSPEVEPFIPTRLREERMHAGIMTADELAARCGIDPAWYVHIEAGRVLPTGDELARLTGALDGIDPSRLYPDSYRTIIGSPPGETQRSVGGFFKRFNDEGHMLVARDEVTWFERYQTPDHRVEVVVNMSCSTQRTPVLLLDTVAVLSTLGVSFVAAAGPTACCGKPLVGLGDQARDRLNAANRNRSTAWGATTHVNWCTSCQQTSSEAAARRLLADGVDHPLREVQLLTFLEERIIELGADTPWRREVRCRVLAEGMPQLSSIHGEAHEAVGRLLALVPGVEVVGLYDGWSPGSPCEWLGRAADALTSEAQRNAELTPEAVRGRRRALADHIRSLGADTVSCQHQYCHLVWSRYASDELAVRHAVSIVAEALDCAHPDRYQAAVRLGDPRRFMDQTRPVWESWGISEDKAFELATSISDPAFADGGSGCGCDGQGPCLDHVIPIDILAGIPRPN